MKKKLDKYIALLFLIGLIFVFAIYVNDKKNPNLDYYAQKIINLCAKDEYKRGCYDREIPKLLSRNILTMEESFEVTSKIQSKDRSYLYCHILGHELADIETRKDPSKWLDVIARCPALACNNGCAHGAVMRRFKGSEILSDNQIVEIIPDLKIACEARPGFNPSELEISMCYHSLGHLAMYITDANIDKSINICKQIAIKNDQKSYYQTCVQGVFMIVFQSLDDDDSALVAKIKPKKEQLYSFCSRFDGLTFTACRTEAWPYFDSDFAKPAGLASFCSFAKDSYSRDWCFDTGLRGHLSLDILNKDGATGVTKYCLGLPKDQISRCFPSIATAWVQDEPNYIKESVSLCKDSARYGFSDKCFEGLLFFSKFSFNKGSDLWKKYCDNFPTPYKEDCFSGNVPDGW